MIGLLQEHETVFRVYPARRWSNLMSVLRRGDTFLRTETGLLSLLHACREIFNTLHARNCFHGWLNPSTLWTDPFEPMQISDLGCAGFGPGERGALGPWPDEVQRCYAAPESIWVNSPQPMGPWSDVYCVAALLYHWVRGEPPIEAAARVRKDEQAPLIEALAARRLQNFRTETLHAIDQGLQLDAGKRPRSFDQWMRGFPSSDPARSTVSRVKFITGGSPSMAKQPPVAASGLVSVNGGLEMSPTLVESWPHTRH